MIEQPDDAAAIAGINTWIRWVADQCEQPLIRHEDNPTFVYDLGDLVLPSVHHIDTGERLGHVVVDDTGTFLFVPAHRECRLV